ncbi:hypothetical protein BCR32DRAFT_281389 [Anaeromyces robustus]|uniref:Uncharacterized protein n=1 Tax=Anaeromyces robustus TaxID=1754192 RepID=A0A1Y1X0V4_9FUNG|nr:hypothetical protein BCR32DRAFT_281389 [Anaeromyces robustus]|eukprot:ORX79441.1 hypothetical protein BCR32DRAFT_281389 [Anaeromyces robustus]
MLMPSTLMAFLGLNLLCLLFIIGDQSVMGKGTSYITKSDLAAVNNTCIDMLRTKLSE